MRIISPFFKLNRAVNIASQLIALELKNSLNKRKSVIMLTLPDKADALNKTLLNNCFWVKP